HDAPIEEVDLGPEGTLAVRTQLAGKAYVASYARLWHVGTGLPLTPPLDHPGDVRCFAFSPDGRTLLTAGRGGARFGDTSRGVSAGPPLYHQGDVRAAAFSRDGGTLMTLDAAVRLWQAPRGFRRGAPLTHGAAAYAVTFSPDGKLVLTGGEDGTNRGIARLWHTDTGRPVTEPLRDTGRTRTSGKATSV